MCAMRVVQTDVFDEGDLSKHIALPVNFVWTAIGKRNCQVVGCAKQNHSRCEQPFIDFSRELGVFGT